MLRLARLARLIRTLRFEIFCCGDADRAQVVGFIVVQSFRAQGLKFRPVGLIVVKALPIGS